MIAFADKVGSIKPFKVMEILARANQLKSKGHPVIDMEVGEPDFPTPKSIVSAAREALDNGLTKYTNATGYGPLKQAISDYYRSDFGCVINPDRIIVTTGGSGALLLAVALLTNPLDGWLMTDPGYPCNKHFVLAFNGIPQQVPVTASDNYQLRAELIRRYWQGNTRVALLASPANPTGTVVPVAEIQAIHETVVNLGGALVVDEIYQGLTFDANVKESALQASDDIVVVNSFSKYFCMTGWRLGWMVVPEVAVAAVGKLAQNLFICPSSIAQHAAVAAFEPSSRAEMENYRCHFQARRDFLVPALRDLGFRIQVVPAGAFYIYAGLPDGYDDSEAFCRMLLEDHFVAMTPGTDFGAHQADEFVRISYAQDISLLAEAVERIRTALTA